MLQGKGSAVYRRGTPPEAVVAYSDNDAVANEQIGALITVVQPAELISCAVWQPQNGLYLASDGFTVRPLPGSDAAAFGSAPKQLRHA